MSRQPRLPVKPPVRRALAACVDANPTHPFCVGVADRIGYVLGKKGWPFPYAVLSFVAVSPRDTLTEQLDAVLPQVVVYSPSSLEAEDLAAAALNLFTGRPLSAAGIHDFVLHRFGDIPTLPDNESDATVIWRAGVTLAGLVQTKL
uniref:Uncharacterized protein n=1 Tax=Desulfovibrio sp. U5L TaxID=596152 RepID=I2Q2N5_9BACT